MDFTKLSYGLCRRYLLDCDALTKREKETILGWIRSRNLVSLTTCSTVLDPALHDQDRSPLDEDREKIRALRQIEAFFKKNASLTCPLTESSAAMSTFHRGERICRITNKRLDYYHTHWDRVPEEIRIVIERMQRDIASLLGPASCCEKEFPFRGKITAGATATRSMRLSQPFRKARIRRLDSTVRAERYLRPLLSCMGYEKVSFNSLSYNRVAVVPKNWKTGRTIAAEPEGNQFLQLGVDSYLKDKLRNWRVDLRDQSKNQRMSKAGSIDDRYSTIDLSMASDLLSYNTVFLLLPFDWAKMLDTLRSPLGLLPDGTFVNYAKFSSMGNGCTFTLESLIFASACRALTEDFAVYGDDIIIPPCNARLLIKVLQFLGFRVNEEKSFIRGPFKESCGTDWYNGVEITPFYLRQKTNLKNELCLMVNGLVAISKPGGHLSSYLRTIVSDEDLPLIPFHEDPTCGVFVELETARRNNLVFWSNDGRKPRKKGDQPIIKGYRTKCPTFRRYGSDVLGLWYLNALRSKVSGERQFRRLLTWLAATETLEILDRRTSSVPGFSHKYEKTWVRWCKPSMATPVHLYWWSDYVSRIS